MNIDLSEAQIDLERRFRELVDDELAPAVRRMGEWSADESDPSSESGMVADTRQAVWRALVDLGATRLLLPPGHGGEDSGQLGAVMLAERLGSALYQGPLLDTMLATEALLHASEAPRSDVAGRDMPDDTSKRLAEIAEGAAIPVAVRDDGRDHHARPGLLESDAEGTTISAQRRFVDFALDGRYLLVIGRSADPSAGQAVHGALVARDHPSISFRRQEDVGRGHLYAVRCDQTPVLSWHGDAVRGCQAWPRVVAHARIRHAAYLVGLSQGALDLAVARVTQRKQFGRPIGQFQALAHRLAQLATRVEGARWLVRAAAWEADRDEDVRLSAAQAVASAADLAGDITVAAMQMHGAHGMTEEADIQLYYRRACIDRAWMGAAAELRREVAPLLIEAMNARRPGSGHAR